jgi:tRNA nucleotidyltransferase (CCA-adding enzyme)
MSDYNFLMESRLSPSQFRVLNHLSRIAAEQGLNLYLVGGAVRDLTYGQQTVRDLDFVVEGNPQRMLSQLEAKSKGGTRKEGRHASREPEAVEIERLRVDKRLQSAEFTFTHGVRGELAMARNEFHTKPGRRPEIALATIFEDLQRRDFSVNAMAVSLHPNSRGLLLDPTNGGADVESRELRVLHSRSFLEDPSRVYRLLRLGLRLGFKPAERTKQYFESALENRAWEHMDPELQGRELRAVLQEENPGRVLKLYAGRGMLQGLDRKLARLRIPSDRFNKIRSVVRSLPDADPFLLNFYSLVEKFGAGQRIRLARKIVPYREDIELVFGFDREARKVGRVLSSSKASLPSQVYALLSGQPLPLLLFLLVYYPKPKIQNRVRNFLFKYPQVRARLPRAELQALGVKPGPQFDKILDRIFVDQLDGKIRNHAQLLKALRDYAGIKEPPPKPVKAAKLAKPVSPPPAKAKAAAAKATPAPAPTKSPPTPAKTTKAPPKNKK